MNRFLIIGLIALFVCSGCSWFAPKEEKPAQALAVEGMNCFKDGSYGKCIKAFEKLKDWYPYSKFAMLAELKIADAHFQLKEYEEAFSAYEEFESLHPRNEAIPYVVYQMGLCDFVNLSTSDRDQEPARKAKATFNRLIREFPKSEYANKAEEYIKKCNKSLAEYVLRIGEWNYKIKHYKAALYRFKDVIADYPDVGFNKKALKYVLLCEAALKKQESEKKQ